MARGKGTAVTVLWIIVSCLLAVVWVLSVLDIFRRHYSTWTTVGWIALIVVLPFIGSLIYWTVRKPTGAETEQEYLAEADLRRAAATRRIDPNG
jgi:phospholipase D-like protein